MRSVVIGLLLCVSCGKEPRVVTLFSTRYWIEMRDTNDVVLRQLAGVYPTSMGRLSEQEVFVWYNVGGTRKGYRIDGGLWGLLKRISPGVNRFEERTEPVFESFKEFSNGLAAVKQNKRWGFIDSTGKLVIPFDFDTAMSRRPHYDEWYYTFRDGNAWVRQNGLSFQIDKSGKRISNQSYDLDQEFTAEEDRNRQGFYVKWFKENERWGLLDDEANVILSPVMERPLRFQQFMNDFYWMQSDEKWGLWDGKQSGWKLTPQFDHILVLRKQTRVNVGGQMMFQIINGGLWALVDSSGSMVVQSGGKIFVEKSPYQPVEFSGQE